MVDQRESPDERVQTVPPSTARASIGQHIRAAAKKLLPNSSIHELQRFRAYPGRERALYLKIRALNAVGLINSRISRPPGTARSFLFVCFGNIMRSPMCEALLKQALQNLPSCRVTVNSAGLNAVPGRAAHPWAIAAAHEFGISLENHRARLLTEEMVNQADAVFAMDYGNLTQLLSRHPGTHNKFFMLSSYASEDYPSVEIADPYYSGEEATHTCYTILNKCIENLVSSLCRE